MSDPRSRPRRSRHCAGLATLVLTACSGSSGPTPNGPTPITGADADRIVAVATHCIQGEPWSGAHLGYGLLPREATVHRAAKAGALALVRVPEGMYTGRLPPPRPASALWLEVDPDAKTCREVAAP